MLKLGKKDALELPTVEELRKGIIEHVNKDESGKFKALLEVWRQERELSAAIEEAEEERDALEKKFSPHNSVGVDIKKYKEVLNNSAPRYQAIHSIIDGYERKHYEIKQELGRMHTVVWNELQEILAKTVTHRFQKIIDVEAEKMLALLQEVESRVEQCGLFYTYIPEIKDFSGLRAAGPYALFCPPRELWRWLKRKCHAFGGLS